MSRSRTAISRTPAEAIDAMVALYGTALVEVTSAVMAEIARGKRPERSHQAEFSIGSAGMPSMSDGFYNRSGPPTYSSLIEPQKDQPRDGLSLPGTASKADLSQMLRQ